MKFLGYGRQPVGGSSCRSSHDLVGRFLAAFLVAGFSLWVSGCASVSPSLSSQAGDSEEARTTNDPYEHYNRAMFAFNDSVDGALIKPVAQAYRDAVHPGVRQMVSNFFGNIGDVWTAINQLLQGKPAMAASDFGRVLINTIAGFGGIADFASAMGIEKHREDFGQTLGRWGVGSGPYLVLPFFGPSSLRDAPSLVGDLYADPLGNVIHGRAFVGAWGVRVTDRRAELIPAEKLLESVALDRYSFIRDGYLQRRYEQVWDGNPPDEKP
jgi:phospholipid-binding lipoprotein MlaA